MIKITVLRLTVFSVVLGFLMAGSFMFSGLQATAKAQEFAGEIVIGDDEEVTGPYAATTYCHAEAAQDYWNQRNYRMKVDGKTYKIRHLFVDNKTNVSLSVSNFHRFVAEGAVIVRTNWTPGMVALFPLAKKAGVPILGGGFSRQLIDPPSNYMFLLQPSYPGMLCAGVKWYKENVWKGPGKMKVGILLVDSAFGRSSHIDSVYAYLKEDLGVEVLPTQFFPGRIKDFTPQLMRFKKQGVNLIYMQYLAGQYALLAKDAKRLNITPKTGLMSTLWCVTDKYVELAGKAAEGTYGLWHWYVDPADDNPSLPIIKQIHDAMEKYRGNRYYDINYIQGYMYHHVIQHILELTIKKHGFPITPKQVSKALSELKGWDWGISRYFSGYDGGDRLGWHEVRAHQVKNGKVVTASDWLPEPAEFLKREPWITGGR